MSSETDLQPTRKAVSKWLETQDTLKLIGLVFGALISVGTVISFFIGIGVRLAKEDFMTTQAAHEMEVRLVAQCQQELATYTQVRQVKDEAIASQISKMADDNRTSNANIESKLSEFTRTLITWSRGR